MRATALTVAAFLWMLAGSASAQVQVFTDESAFVAALSGAPESLVDFNASPIAGIVGNEFAAQGFLFSTPIVGIPGQMEIAPAAFFSPTPYLNIGLRPFQSGDGDHDDLNVDLLGTWNAASFRLVDGQMPFGAEAITFFDANSNILYQRLPVDGTITFLGIIASAPIDRFFVDEAFSDGDDVGYDDFRIAAVPEPTTLLLVGTALASAGLWRRFRRVETHYSPGSYS